MAAPYIPSKSAGFDSWLTNFATLIAANPATYGLTTADATAISAAQAAFHAAYLLGGVLADGKTPVNPSTRTPVTVADMKSQQSSATVTVRLYASQIRLNPGVSNADKVALGLNLPNTTPSPIPAPSSMPLLSLVNSNPMQLQMSYKDSMAGTGKAKAPGAMQVQLVGGASATPITNPDTAPTIATPTKSPFLLQFAPTDSGKTCYMFARYVTRKGLTGPWAAVVTAIVP